MLQKTYIFSFIISALMLISCNRESGIGGAHLSDGAISFSPSIVRADWSAVSDTKGAFSMDIPSIGVMAFWSTLTFAEVASTITPNLMYNQCLTQGVGNAWAPTTTHYWPMGDNESSFFAYSPYAPDATNGITVSAKTHSGVPTISYTMPMLAASQPDLLVAGAHKDIPYIGDPIPVALSFDRALASIGFKLEGTDSETVSSIGINNIVVGGTILMSDLGPTNTWKNLSNSDPTDLYLVGLEGGTVIVQPEPTSAMADDGYLMVIPQIYSEDTKVVAMINGVETSIILPIGGQWQWGKRYIYTIIVSEGILVKISLVVIPWGGGAGFDDTIEDPPPYSIEGWEDGDLGFEDTL